MLKEELDDLFMASSSSKVQRRAELTIQQVGITVALLQKQLGGLHLPIPTKGIQDVERNICEHTKTPSTQFLILFVNKKHPFVPQYYNASYP